MNVRVYVFIVLVLSTLAVTVGDSVVQANSFCNGKAGRKMTQGCGNNDLFSSSITSSGPGTGIVFEDCGRYKTMQIYGVYLTFQMVKKFTAECKARNAKKNELPVLHIGIGGF